MLPPILNSPSGSFPPTVIKNGGLCSPLHMLMHAGVIPFWIVGRTVCERGVCRGPGVWPSWWGLLRDSASLQIHNFITHFCQKLLNTHTKLFRKTWLGTENHFWKWKNKKTDDPPFSSSNNLWPPLSAHQKSHDPSPHSTGPTLQ